MNRISNVQFRHGLVDRMLRTGTLMIVASSDDPLEFDDIPEVQKVHSLLYRQVFDATKRSALGGYPNTDTTDAALLPTITAISGMDGNWGPRRRNRP